MEPRLVVVAANLTPWEANLAKSQLEAAGVQAFLNDVAMSSMAWHLSTAIGGVKPLVSSEDVGKAIMILDRVSDNAASEPDESDAAGDGGNAPDAKNRDAGVIETPKWAHGEAEKETVATENDEENDDDYKTEAKDAKDGNDAGAVSVGDDFASRALNSALVGLFCLPASLVSVHYGERAMAQSATLSSRGWRNLVLAAAMDIGIISLVIYLLIYMTRSR